MRTATLATLAVIVAALALTPGSIGARTRPGANEGCGVLVDSAHPWHSHVPGSQSRRATTGSPRETAPSAHAGSPRSRSTDSSRSQPGPTRATGSVDRSAASAGSAHRRDRRVAPMADGFAAIAQPAPPRVTARLPWSIMRRALTGSPVTIPVAGAPGSSALIAAPEAPAIFERLASGGGWRNEVSAAGLLIPLARFRPVQHAARIPRTSRSTTSTATGPSTSTTSPATSSTSTNVTCSPPRRTTPRPAGRRRPPLKEPQAHRSPKPLGA